MQESGYITFFINRKEVIVSIRTIIYVIMNGKFVEIHTSSGPVHKTRMKFSDIEDALSDDFIKIHRGCIVSAMAIHEVNERISLSNGETLMYTRRKKREILNSLEKIQKNMIDSFNQDGIPMTDEDYKAYYKSFEKMPFAFTDIELIFNDDSKAVDWVFRYGNKALVELEKVSIDKLIGHSFKSVFPNMDEKWLRAYERATLYEETLEIIDYSPEIDTNLKVICFPTFKGHCGCILFNIGDIKFIKSSNDAEKALMLYLGQMVKNGN